MSRAIAIAALGFACAYGLVSSAARAGESEAAQTLAAFLSAEQAGAMHVLGNWLATYNLDESQVDKLIAAAGATTSEERRNLLWHALRCTRSRAAREYLQRNLVEDSDKATRLRFLHSFTNLDPFDVPLLISLYQAAEDEPRDKSGALMPLANVQDAIVQLATREDSALAAELNGRPDFIPDGGTYPLNQHRAKQARQAKAELLVWIARNTSLEAHRLIVILPAYDILGSDHQKQLALDLLAIVKQPSERARIMPLICRRYGIDLVPYLVKDSEEEATKLAILEALHMLGSSYGYTMSAVSHGQSTYQYLSKNDPSPQVREAAARLLHRLSGGGSRGPGEPPQ